MQHYRSMKTNGGTKVLQGVYNQQFKGTFKKSVIYLQ
jgi:hypothetical protein